MTYANFSKTFNGKTISAFFFMLYNMITLFVEYSLLKTVYYQIPELEKPIDTSNESRKKLTCVNALDLAGKFITGWRVYFKQGLICIAGVAVAIRSMSLLGFDYLTIAYAKNQGLTEFAISIIEAVGSVSCILGVLTFPLLHNKFKLSLIVSALIGFIVELVFIVVALSSIWLPGSPFELYKDGGNHVGCVEGHLQQSNTMSLVSSNSAIGKESDIDHFIFSGNFFTKSCNSYVSVLVLLFSIAASRFGLCLFDLSIQQLIQETIPETERGIFSGMQIALNMIFDLLTYGLAIFLPKMETFGYLVIYSVCCVFFSFLLYCLFVFLAIRKKKYARVSQF